MKIIIEPQFALKLEPRPISATFKGIDWVNDSEWVVVKIMIGDYTSSPCRIGTMGESIEQQLFQIVGDLTPWLIPRFKRESHHKGTMAEVLMHRARFCWPEKYDGNDELVPLQAPGFKATWDLATTALAQNKRLYPGSIMEAQTANLITPFNGAVFPGAYVCQSHLCHASIYVGEGSDALTRGQSHLSDGLHLRKVFPTTSKSSAVKLQDAIHRVIRSIPGTWGPQKKKGYFDFPDGDGVEIVAAIVEHLHKYSLDQENWAYPIYNMDVPL